MHDFVCLPIAHGFMTTESYLAEWKRLIKEEQAERRASRQYLAVYAASARNMKDYIDTVGWARAKGFYKKLIKRAALELRCDKPFHPADLDSILDGLGC